MAEPTTITVVPTSHQRRGFRQWAGPRGVATLPGNGFAVPVELLGEIPTDLLLGARVNGEIYWPAAGQVGHDAPPVDGFTDDDLPDAGELAHREGDWIGPLGGELVGSPEVVAGFPQPPADDIPTTGAPALEGDDSP